MIWSMIICLKRALSIARTIKKHLFIEDSINYRGHTIGCMSTGDPGSSQKESLEKLLKEDCDIVVAASRSYGKTVEDADELAKLVLIDLNMDSVGVIRLEDVADVEQVDDSAEVYAKLNYKNIILIFLVLDFFALFLFYLK